MPDNNQSGAPSTTPGAASTGENPGFGAFGANRGSGLVRGKRAAPAAASAAAPAASSGYKPSSLEVITSKSEYVNPFTGETTVIAPVTNEPAPQADPVAPAQPATAVAPAPQAAPAALASEASAKEAELFPLDPPAAPAEKSALKILPTEEPRRPAVSWESPAGAPAAQPQRRDERPTFRPEQERREGKPFAPREPRRDERKFEPRDKQPYPERRDRPERTPQAAPEKKSGGFFGWLKGLFGGSKSAETPATGGDFRPDRDGEHGGRRRHRGGRGRGSFRGDNRGGQPYQHRDPRDEADQPRQGGDQSGEQRGDGQFGGGRRRQRGGRGRFRGEGGDRGPHPEGQEGGGAI